jgi:hypothetical protein
VVTYIGIEAGIKVHARLLYLAVQAMNDSEGCSRLIQVDFLIIKAGIPSFYGKNEVRRKVKPIRQV